MKDGKPSSKTFEQLQQQTYFVCVGLSPAKIMFKSQLGGAQQVRKIHGHGNCHLKHEVLIIEPTAEVQEIDVHDFSA